MMQTWSVWVHGRPEDVRLVRVAPMFDEEATAQAAAVEAVDAARPYGLAAGQADPWLDVEDGAELLLIARAPSGRHIGVQCVVHWVAQVKLESTSEGAGSRDTGRRCRVCGGLLLRVSGRSGWHDHCQRCAHADAGPVPA
jgi:hypothetical protein